MIKEQIRNTLRQLIVDVALLSEKENVLEQVHQLMQHEEFYSNKIKKLLDLYSDRLTRYSLGE